MAEPKKTSVTFTFEDTDDGRYILTTAGDMPDISQTYVLWIKCMEVLLSAPDLRLDKKTFIQNVYNHVMSPAEKVASSSEKMPLRIVTVYKAVPQAPDKDEYVAIEYHTLADGAERTGWFVRGSYKKVTAAIRKAFGILEKIPRDPTDDPSVVENWI